MDIQPIATIRTPFKCKFGIPRQSGRSPSAVGEIHFFAPYGDKDAVRGLEGFSHLWLIFDFSEAHQDINLTVRPPRLGGNTRMGVFATRSPYRPNSLGLSVVKLEDIKSTPQGTVLVVSGVDLLDGTPIYDIKPYVFSDVVQGAKFGFAAQGENHKLKIENPHLLSPLPPSLQQTAMECLCDDPRVSYKQDGHLFKMKLGEWDIHFCVSDDLLTIVKVDKCDDQN